MIGDALDRAILAVIDAEYGGTAQDPDIRQRGEFDVSLSRPGDAGHAVDLQRLRQEPAAQHEILVDQDDASPGAAGRQRGG